MSAHKADRVRRAPVMADVARMAGVSHQTVSRVVNDAAHVRPETRQRVLAAMRLLDYRPNPVARALVTGRSQTLGVVSFDTTLYGPASTLAGIERAAREEGYYVSVVMLRSLDRQAVIDAVARLGAQGVDGILVIAPRSAVTHALLHLPAGVPVVAVEADASGPLPVVAVDQHAGAIAATRHLLELGHATVRHIAGPRGDWLEAEQRVAGWRAALQAAGAEVREPLVGDWSPRAGYELGQRLMEEPGITAVFVANDQMALGLLRLLHEQGRELPREVSVVGFDDIPEASYFTPPLTTVRQDFDEMGRRGLHLLLDSILDGADGARSSTVPPQLVVRSSTAPPPG